MGMYISFHEDKEKLLRKMAKEQYGDKKGALTAVLEEALDVLQKEKQRQAEVENAIARMKKGFDMGLGNRKAYEKRSDLYDRPGLPR